MRQLRIGEIILTIYISSSFAIGFAPLGSEPVDKCNVYKYECPSHYICESHNRINHGDCICDRFYGFYGPTCEKLSVASYLLGVCCVLCFILTSKSLYLNLQLAYELHQRSSLKRNTLSRCLFFNILGTLPVLAWEVGFFITITSIDRQMFFHEYIRPPAIASLLVTLVLSTMSISLAWIETAEKTRGVPNSHWKYKLLLYGTSVFSFSVSFIAFRFNMIDMVAVCQGIAVSFSYFQAGHMVTEALSVMEENGDIVVYQGASDVLYTIKNTSKKMMMYSLLFSFSSAVAGFTITIPTPKYKKQNHLPRYLQGQLFIFMIGVCTYHINIALLDYLKSSAKRQLAKPPVNRTFWEWTKDICPHLCFCCCFFCFFDTRCCGLFNLHKNAEATDELSVSSLEMPPDLSSVNDEETSQENTAKMHGEKPTWPTFDDSRGLRYSLSCMISNYGNGNPRANREINHMISRRNPQVAAIGSGRKIGSKKAGVIPTFNSSPPMSSEMSSLTEGSIEPNQQDIFMEFNRAKEEGPGLGLGTLRRLIHNHPPVDFDDGDDDLYKVSVGLNHLPLVPLQKDNHNNQTSISLARVQRRGISVVEFDANDSNDDMSSVTMPEALKASKSNDISCLVPHACLDNNSTDSSSSSSSSKISATTPIGPPPKAL